MKKRTWFLLWVLVMILLAGCALAERQNVLVNGEIVPEGRSIQMTEFDPMEIGWQDEQPYYKIDYEFYGVMAEGEQWLTGGNRTLNNDRTFELQVPEGYTRIRVQLFVLYVGETYDEIQEEDQYSFYIDVSPSERTLGLLNVEISKTGDAASLTVGEDCELYAVAPGWGTEKYKVKPGEVYEYLNETGTTVKLYAIGADGKRSETFYIQPPKLLINRKNVQSGDTIEVPDFGDVDINVQVEDGMTAIEYTAFSAETGEPLSNGPFRFNVEEHMTNAYTFHSQEPLVRYEFRPVYKDGSTGDPFEFFISKTDSGAELDGEIATVDLQATQATVCFNQEAQLYVMEGTLGGFIWPDDMESVTFSAGDAYTYKLENYNIPRTQTVTLCLVAREQDDFRVSSDYVLTGSSLAAEEEIPEETDGSDEMIADAEIEPEAGMDEIFDMIADAGETSETQEMFEPVPVQAEIEYQEPEKLIYGGVTYRITEGDVYNPQTFDSTRTTVVEITGGIGLEDVVIPAEIDGYPVVEISSRAFRDDTAIRSLTVEPTGVFQISTEAFEGCANLTTVKLNGTETLYSVYTDAFRGIGADEVLYADGKPLDMSIFSKADGRFCWAPDGKGGAVCTGMLGDAEADLVIPDTLGGLPVTGIRNSAFEGFNELKTVTLPKTVTSIGSFAFAYDSELTEIRGGTLETVDVDAFFRSARLASVEGVDFHRQRSANFDEYIYRDGIVTDSTGTWRYYVDAEGNAVLTGFADGVTMKKCVIPEAVDGYSVGRIAENAFDGQKSITSVSFPEGLYAIGANAFRNTGITSLSFPSSLLHIDSWAFSQCEKLKTILFPASVGYWGNRVFSECKAVTSVKFEEGVTSIPDYMFYGFEAMKTITIPASVRRVGTSVFADSGLTKITLPATVEEWGKDVFRYSSLTSVTIEDGITVIPERMFISCKLLTSVTLPPSVKTVGESAFRYCYKLTKVTLNEGLEKIEDYAFDSAPLTKIVLPASLKSIGNRAFASQDRKSLSVTAKGERTAYGNGVFDGTGSEENDIYAKSGWKDFKPQMHLTTYTGSTADLLYGYNVKKTYVSRGPESVVTAPVQAVLTREMFDAELQIEELTIPEGVEELADDFMASMFSLTKIKLPKSLKKIGNHAFFACSNLKTIELPKGLESIGDYAFSRCIQLKEITIPDTVTTIGEAAFSDCDALKKATLPKGITGIPAFCFSNAGIKQMTIPATVQTIGEGAFGQCYDLTSVTLPKGLTEIPDRCFLDDRKLATINLPVTLERIGEHAFLGCGKLTSVTLPKTMKTLSKYCLSATGIAKIVIPESVETIGEGAFYGCQKLKSITLPKGLTEIPNSCFGRTGFTSFKVPETVRVIRKFAFANADLQTITLPEGLEEIEDGAFDGCLEFMGFEMFVGQLKELKIPSTVVRIGENAFRGHENLKKVTLLNPDTEIGKDAFLNVPGYKGQ